MKKIISFVGAPGCGKGFLIKKFTETAIRNNMLSPENIAIISIGNIIRTEIKNKTKLGIKIQKSKREGCLAPDSLIIPLLKKELHKTKASIIILDGYPRTQRQFELLCGISKGYNLNIIHRDTPENIIKKRIEQRRICSMCGCEHIASEVQCCCGGNLIQRKEDTVWSDRMAEYKEVTLPMINEIKNENYFYTLQEQNLEDCDLTSLVTQVLSNKDIKKNSLSLNMFSSDKENN